MAWSFARETEFRQIRFANFEYEISERVRIPDFHLAELDWNEDGYVQKDEVPGKIARYVKFNEIDLNKDGEIDAIEAGQINSQVEGARERIDLRRDDGGGVELLNETELLGNWTVRMREEDESVQKSAPIAELFMTRYEGVFRETLGSRQDMENLFSRSLLSDYPYPLTLVCLPFLLLT